tara:strand:- start:118 stop:1011 length:894 start_codon:yes stop_codon:yes gene_type:complete
MKKHLPIDDLEAIANENVGEALRQTRIFYGKSLDDVEKDLRIRASQIDAIERGDISSLPGRAYAIGFVRSYAEYLDIDGATTVRLFKAHFMEEKVKEDLSFPVPASETKTPPYWVVAVGIFVVIGLFYTLYIINKPDRAEIVQIAEVSEDIKKHISEGMEVLEPEVVIDDPIIAVSEASVAESLPDDVENMGANGNTQVTGIILKILGDCWVEIKNEDKKIIVSNILAAGDQYFVPDSPGLTMSIGNASNIEIMVEGRTLQPLGKSGDVRRDIPLNTAYLKTLEFQSEDDDTMSVEP